MKKKLVTTEKVIFNLTSLEAKEAIIDYIEQQTYFDQTGTIASFPSKEYLNWLDANKIPRGKFRRPPNLMRMRNRRPSNKKKARVHRSSDDTSITEDQTRIWTTVNQKCPGVEVVIHKEVYKSNELIKPRKDKDDMFDLNIEFDEDEEDDF